MDASFRFANGKLNISFTSPRLSNFKRMKKLLQINPVLRINTSTGRIMQEIGELARQNGWESYIAYSRGRDGEMTCGSHTLPVGNKWSVAWHGAMTRLLDRHGLASTEATKHFISQIERLRPDIIHLHNLHGYFLNYKILFDYLSHSGIPVVWTVHDCWLYTGHCYYYSFANCHRWKGGCGHCPQQRKFPASWLSDRSRRNYSDKMEAFTSIPKDQMVVVAVSDWIRGEMRHSFMRKYDMRVIHNGIDTGIFRPCVTGPATDAENPDISVVESIKRKYHLEGKQIYLGVASIWSKEKGIDDFLRLAHMLNEDEKIVLVGVDERLGKRLPQHIITIARTGNIHQLAALYSSATAFINPTWQDNYPTVNLEAIACGTPVITYRTGGSVEAVTEATGIIVEQGDVEGLLNAARIVAAKGKEIYREACRRHAINNFRKQDCYAKYIDLYNKLIQT